MPGSSLDIKTLCWILAGIFSAVFAIVGNELSVNIIRWFSKKGPRPKGRPAYLWIIFFGSLIASILLGAFAAFGIPKEGVNDHWEYIGFVVNTENEPVPGARVTLSVDDMTQMDITDSEGMYRFEVPADSNLSGRIDVTVDGFQAYSTDIRLDVGAGTIAEIRLLPETVVSDGNAATNIVTEKSPTPLETDTDAWATISCDVEQASLRRSPGYIDKDDLLDVLVRIDCGQRVRLLGDKRDADHLTWWNVSWNGYIGWMADHTGSGRVILIFD